MAGMLAQCGFTRFAQTERQEIHRLSPADALRLLEANFLSGPIVALGASTYTSVLRRAPDSGLAGGRTYDAGGPDLEVEIP
jgi:hypothetical protein